MAKGQCEYYETPVLESGSFHTPHNAKSTSMLALARAVVQSNAARHENLAQPGTQVHEVTAEHVNALFVFLTEQGSRAEGCTWSYEGRTGGQTALSETELQVIGTLQEAVTAVLYSYTDSLDASSFSLTDLTMGQILEAINKVMEAVGDRSLEADDRRRADAIRTTIASAEANIRKFLRVG